MLDIPVICGSTRKGRKSIRVARFIHRTLGERSEVDTSLVDLEELELPMMKERLRFDDDPPKAALRWSAIINRADGIIIVTPEYNYGYPGVLKNAIDYLQPEFDRKPVGLVTVSAGSFGGVRCLDALRQTIFGVGAFPIPSSLPVSKVSDAFDEDGTPLEAAYVERADQFLDRMIWFTEAIVERKRLEQIDDEEEE